VRGRKKKYINIFGSFTEPFNSLHGVSDVTHSRQRWMAWLSAPPAQNFLPS